ncbi:MAG: RNase J family beta-CASP ribonuclease [Actinobacteria bacterium]|nr:RNase J family beta-CASP ribonuclease [Actinomycetota bacterium]
MSPSGSTRVVFLGGLGEIGRNMMVFEKAGKLLIVDVGLSFPNDEMLGVDLVLPDFSYVVDRAPDCVGVVLTHGHEDHVGALTWFLREVEVPVYGTPLTLGLARRRLDEHGVKAEMVAVEAPGRGRIGPFDCTFFPVSHSIPDAIGISLKTEDGRILYTSDFKLDEAPIDGRHTDVGLIRELAEEGVDLLLSDSTNVETPGRTPSESIVGDAFREIFGAARRRIIVACFASNLHRVQQVLAAAEEVGRKVALAGRSMIANVEVGRELGHIKVSDRTLIDLETVDDHRPENLVIVCTGSQGEPLSALSLIAAGEHKWVRVQPDDTVILSASPIPGNESAVHRVVNGLYRAGAAVFHSETAKVHASGHAASVELQEMLRLVHPRNFTPVHGEFRQLALHARLAEGSGVARDRIRIVEDGDVLELDDGKVTRGESVRAGTILVDGLGVGDVGPVVLRDRRHLAGDGILVCVVAIDSHNGELISGPDLISRGFVHMDESRDFLDEAADRVADAVETLEKDQITDWAAVKKACRKALGEFVWQETRRRPMILPIVMDV